MLLLSGLKFFISREAKWVSGSFSVHLGMLSDLRPTVLSGGGVLADEVRPVIASQRLVAVLQHPVFSSTCRLQEEDGGKSLTLKIRTRTSR